MQSHNTIFNQKSLKMEIKKALFIAQELTPYLSAGPLAEHTRDAALGVLESGVEVRTFMPKYGVINERRNQLHEVIRLSGLNIVIDDNDHPLVIKVATLQPSRMQVYFIDNEDYFGNNRPGTLEIHSLPTDNDERIMFYVRGVIETVKKLRWVPQLVQCTGWITALAPIYMRHVYGDDPTVRDVKIVYVIQNDTFPGTLHPRFVEKLRLDGLPENILQPYASQPVDYKTLNRIAIDHSDAVVIASDDVDTDLVDYIRQSGKPFIENIPHDNIREAYLDFYKNID